MDKLEHQALERVAQETNPKALRQIASNARGKSVMVERAALRRLASISARHSLGTIENACWAMVHAVEELRRLDGRKVSRMNRMRRKIEKDGEVEALRYCALKQTEGFAEIIAYGTPELTAEAIVLRFPGHFDEVALTAARERLERVGCNADRLVSA